MQKRFVVAFIAVILWLCAFSGCSEEKVEQPSGLATTTSRVTITTKPLIDKDVAVLITKEELSEAVGIPMQEPIVTEQGAGLTCFSEESDRSRVVIDVLTKEKSFFENQVLSGYQDLEACPNLGESAWFSPAYNQLLVYNDGDMITIELTIEGYDDINENRQRCRQIASIILGRL